MTEVLAQRIYPSISERVKAVLTDTIMLIIFMVAFTFLFELFENVPDVVRGTAFVFIFVLYDPVFTSLFGGTIGHMMNGIKVKREGDELKNLVFHLALLRFIIKVLLGWISLLTISGNTKKRAMHDLCVGSVVIYRDEKE